MYYQQIGNRYRGIQKSSQISVMTSLWRHNGIYDVTDVFVRQEPEQMSGLIGCCDQLEQTNLIIKGMSSLLKLHQDRFIPCGTLRTAWERGWKYELFPHFVELIPAHLCMDVRKKHFFSSSILRHQKTCITEPQEPWRHTNDKITK